MSLFNGIYVVVHCIVLNFNKEVTCIFFIEIGNFNRHRVGGVLLGVEYGGDVLGCKL